MAIEVFPNQKYIYTRVDEKDGEIYRNVLIVEEQFFEDFKEELRSTIEENKFFTIETREQVEEVIMELTGIEEKYTSIIIQRLQSGMILTEKKNGKYAVNMMPWEEIELRL